MSTLLFPAFGRVARQVFDYGPAPPLLINFAKVFLVFAADSVEFYSYQKSQKSAN